MTTTESLDMIQVLYGIRQMYMQVWETAEKRFSMGVPVQELFDWCKHEYAEKDTFLERVIEDFKQVHSAQSDLQPTCNHLATDCISRQAAIDDIKAMYEWHDVVTEDRLIEHMKRLPSAQPESLSDAYMKAVWTWLLNYQIKAAELEGRYTPYEVLSWVANDWRKENEIN